MELSAVLKFFSIGQTSTIEDLRAAYSKYEERYHPRNNRGNEQWARQMMAKLDQAYEMADTYLRKRQVHSFYRKLFSESVDEQSRRYTYFNAFHEAVDGGLQAIYTYYQYGLENILLRTEGSRVMRFRTAMREMEESLRRLREIHQYAMDDGDRTNIEVFFNFALAFHENMLIDRRDRPTGGSVDAKAYSHYQRGSHLLDAAIKELFFDEFQSGPREASTSDQLHASSNEFLVILTEFLESSWITQTVIKLHVIEVLTRLMKRTAISP